MKITDRKALIRFASILPKGSEERRTILSAISPVAKTASRGGVLSFSLGTTFSTDDMEEDAEDGESPASEMLSRDDKGNTILGMERKAVKNLERMFGQKISNEGHDRDDALIAKIYLDSPQAVEKAAQVIARNQMDYAGDDGIWPGVRYFAAYDFLFFPDGVGGPSFGTARQPFHMWVEEGDFSEWLEENEGWGE